MVAGVSGQQRLEAVGRLPSRLGSPVHPAGTHPLLSSQETQQCLCQGPGPGAWAFAPATCLCGRVFGLVGGFWLSQLSSSCWFILNREQFGGNGRQL